MKKALLVALFGIIVSFSAALNAWNPTNPLNNSENCDSRDPFCRN